MERAPCPRGPRTAPASSPEAMERAPCPRGPRSGPRKKGAARAAPPPQATPSGDPDLDSSSEPTTSPLEATASRHAVHPRRCRRHRRLLRIHRPPPAAPVTLPPPPYPPFTVSPRWSSPRSRLPSRSARSARRPPGRSCSSVLAAPLDASRSRRPCLVQVLLHRSMRRSPCRGPGFRRNGPLHAGQEIARVLFTLRAPHVFLPLPSGSSSVGTTPVAESMWVSGVD